MEPRRGLALRPAGRARLRRGGERPMTPAAAGWARPAVVGGLLVSLVLWGVALIGQVLIVRPFDGPAAPDAAASVLYFERIMSGRQLEAFVNTTPKPLLTLVFGVLFAPTHDWALISLATVAAGATAAVLGAELVRRIAGLPAAAFAFVALAGLQSLLREVSWAYGLPWATMLWFAAALALVRERPRYGFAGTFLFVAALARPETFFILALATLGVLVLATRDRGAARAALPILAGWLALVVMGVHDWLLIGNPLWWATVAATHAAETPGQRLSVGGVLRETLDRVLGLGLPLILAAAAGVAILVARRSWVVLSGLVALAPMVVLQDVALAWRGFEVLGHYLDPIDLAAVVAAAVAIGAAAERVAELVEGRRGAGSRWSFAARAVLVVVAGGIAVAATPFAPRSEGARAAIGRQAELADREGVVLPIVGSGLAQLGGVTPEAPQIYVPSIQQTRFIVDLGVSLDRVGSLDVRRLRSDTGYPAAGSVVHLDDIADSQAVVTETEWLRTSTPVVARGVRVVPLLADPVVGLWVVRLDPLP